MFDKTLILICRDDKDDFFPCLHLPETTEIASRVSVIRENPTLAEKPAPLINKDPIDPATIEEDLRRLRLIQSIFDKNQNLNDDEEFFETKKTPQKRPIQEVAANSITKRLQVSFYLSKGFFIFFLARSTRQHFLH